MIRAVRKTLGRTKGFIVDSLGWRGAERPYALVGWALLAGLVWVAIDLLVGPSPQILMLPGQLFLLAILAPVCAIDSRFGIIPDSFVVVLAATGLAQSILASWVDGGAVITWWQEWDHVSGPALLAALVQRSLESLVVFAAAALLRAGYRTIRGREGLGFGDVKFIAAATLWTGLAWIPFVLLTAVISAFGSMAILRSQGDDLHGSYEVAFGPHLAVGVWLAVLCAESTTFFAGLP